MVKFSVKCKSTDKDESIALHTVAYDGEGL